MAIVNPFSKVCKPWITLGGRICNLLVPPSPVKKPRLGPFWVDYECIYTCQNPAQAHTIYKRRILFFFEWTYDDED